MSEIKACVLMVNVGSSSIKFSVYLTEEPPKRLIYGKIDRIGLPDTTLTFHDLTQNQQDSSVIEAPDHRSAANVLVDRIEKRIGFASIKAVGHRIVHGMKHTGPELITRELLDELHSISPYDPDHLPGEIELIEAFCLHHPQLPQAACFDTAFHRTMPRVARLLPLPRRFDTMGIQRYGFHGISYAYLMEKLAGIAGTKAALGRVVLAHLGNGASMAAVLEGKSIDTSMGFTPAGGLPMGTRPGDLDPGVAWYLMRTGHITPKQMNDLINHESGLLGLSETTSDMRDLLRRQAVDVRSAEAVELFCYQAKKWIGAFAAALRGLDTLVFSGGIGENAPEVRARICDGLEFLGIEIEEKQNMDSADLISRESSRVAVRVIRTDEEWMLANMICRFFGFTT